MISRKSRHVTTQTQASWTSMILIRRKEMTSHPRSRYFILQKTVIVTVLVRFACLVDLMIGYNGIPITPSQEVF